MNNNNNNNNNNNSEQNPKNTKEEKSEEKIDNSNKVEDNSSKEEKKNEQNIEQDKQKTEKTKQAKDNLPKPSARKGYISKIKSPKSRIQSTVQLNNNDHSIPIKKNQKQKILLNSFSPNFKSDFDMVSISIANQDDLYSMAKGPITKTDTLNYRTLKPEKGGIFCASIFGPIDDYKCACGRYSGETYKGLRCERCNVLVGSRRLRRLSFGYIDLNTHIVHPWFYSHVCSILKITKKLFTSIINFESFVFIENSYDDLYKKNQIINANQYYSSLFIYEEELKSGGEAILIMLKNINIKQEFEKINNEIKSKKFNDLTDREIRYRDVLYNFIYGGTPLEDLVISVILLMPADLRPILYLEGGGVATTDINDIYRKIINRKNRYDNLLNLETHPIIINNEKYMLNQAICQLMGPQKNKEYKSLADSIKGKKGLFRRALLGKRTDFSGRGSIVVGPELDIDECSLPINMALELFKPFLYSLLMRKQLTYSVVESRKMVEDKNPIIYPLLNIIIKDFPVILNRAPTLHKLGIQAFKIKLTNTNAIRISPLVCIGYNADFDGDQMAVHLPLTIPARIESYLLMLSSKNLFLPSSGRLILLPSKDIVLGIYYISLFGDKFDYKYKLDWRIVQIMYQRKQININTVLTVQITDKKGTNSYQTNYGRMLIWNSVINHNKLDYNIFNQILDKKNIGTLIMHIFYINKWESTLNLLNFLTKTGFYYLTQSGITYSLEDMTELVDREEQIINMEKDVKDIYRSYTDGLITSEELDSNIINEWGKFIESMGDQIIKTMSEDKMNSDDINSVHGNNIYLMYQSGARGSKSQIQQVCCLRGFMARPTGQIGSFVITSNLKNGLKAFEFFESTHGERKGLSDVAIKTATSGHFTRRLVDTSHAVFIQERDCKTESYITTNKTYDKRSYGTNFYDAIFSRVTAKDIVTKKNVCLLKKDEIITQDVYDKIEEENIIEISTYSVLLCEAKEGVCAKCYGMDLSTHKLVDAGTSIGIIAAQSIGEPGTQLTMRTTHTGGIGQAEEIEAVIRSESIGIIDLSLVNYAINSVKETIILYDSIIKIIDEEGNILEEITLQNGYALLCVHNAKVYKNTPIAFKNKNIKNIFSLSCGRIKYNFLIENTTYIVKEDKETGITRKQIITSIESNTENIHPYISVINEETNEITIYNLEENMFILVHENQKIKKGDSLAKLFTLTRKTKDIVGGLPHIIDLFEAKKTDNRAVIATHTGIISISKSKSSRKNKQINILCPENKTKVLNKFIIPSNKHLLVQDQSKIEKGQTILEGNIYLSDLLCTKGYIYTVKYLIGKISMIYEDQGINISYKHFEVIIRQMTKYVLIKQSDIENILVGSIVKYADMLKIENQIKEEEKDLVLKYDRIIMGITKIALNYHSSFISPASFQHTISILANVAIRKSEDYLKGIKESVIFGKRIPAGTGFKDFILEN